MAEYSSGPYNAKKPTFNVSMNADGKNIKKIIIIAAVILVVIITLSGSFYTVADREVGVVTTFGKVTEVTEAGLHFKLPFGMQKVTFVETEVSHHIELGYVNESNGQSVFVENESKMITGDYNIVNVDFFISYRITDPQKYLFSSSQPEAILKVLAQSQIRNVVGSCEIDSVLTEGKAQIQQSIKDLIVKELAEYDIGVSLTDINIQDSEPPTESVSAAFKAVETARQGAEKALNEAEAYKNRRLPEAESEADKLRENAEYLKQSRINEAFEQVAMFNAMYDQYKLNPDITKVRMYYETIEKILPGCKVYIDTGDNGVQKLLPLESLITSETDNTAKGDNVND